MILLKASLPLPPVARACSSSLIRGGGVVGKASSKARRRAAVKRNRFRMCFTAFHGRQRIRLVCDGQRMLLSDEDRVEGLPGADEYGIEITACLPRFGKSGHYTRRLH